VQKKNHIKQLFFIIIVIIGVVIPSHSLCNTKEDGLILIVSSYNPESIVMSKTINNFGKVYHSKSNQQMIAIENLNSKSLQEAPLWRARMGKILSKYETNTRPSVIILLGQEAWSAFLSRPKGLMEGVPVLAGLVSRRTVFLPDTAFVPSEWNPEMFDVMTDKYDRNPLGGYFYDYEVGESLNLIHKLIPQVNKVAVLTDNTFGGLLMQCRAKQAFRKHLQYKPIYIDGRKEDVYKILFRIRSLSENTAILVGTWRVDVNDNYFLNNVTHTMAEDNPTIPAFTLSSVGLGYWTIGGIPPRYQLQGADLAHSALALVLGETTLSELKCHNILPLPVFDEKKMKQFNISKKDLPSDTVYINQSEYWWMTHKESLMLFAIILLSLIVIVFLFYSAKMKKLQTFLAEERNKAERSDRLKSTFLANMSHEIRTPLNAIVGFSELLAETSNPEEIIEYKNIIENNSDLLLQLIGDILDLSKIDAGTYDFIEKKVNVIILLDEIVRAAVPRAKPGVAILFESNFSICELWLDKNRFSQVVNNFINNAIKFTTKGRIVVSVGEELDGDLCFYVTDTGKGIPKDKVDKVFDRFVKLDAFVQGTGLGLSICKVIIEKIGGEIGVDSVYGEGSTFWFTVPRSYISMIKK